MVCCHRQFGKLATCPTCGGPLIVAKGKIYCPMGCPRKTPKKS